MEEIIQRIILENIENISNKPLISRDNSIPITVDINIVV